MATKKKAAKPTSKKAAPKKAAKAKKPAPVKRGKFTGTYSEKLTKNWNPKSDSKAAQIEKLLKKGKTAKEIVEITGFLSNTVVARISDYRRIHKLAGTGKVYNNNGELVDRKGVVKPVKKVTKPVPVAKKKAKPVAGKKKAAAKKVMGIAKSIPDDAVEIEPVDPLFADTDPIEEDDTTPIM